MFGFLKRKIKQPQNHNFVSAVKPVSANTMALVGQDISTIKKVINFSLYLLIFATPLLFLSVSSQVQEFNKQALLFFGVLVMLGASAIRIMTKRNVSWVKTSLDYILLVYLFVYLVASLLSIDKVSSFLGYYGRFTGSFISVLVFIVFYFLVVNNVRSEKIVQRIINCLWASTGLVLVYSLFQLLGWFIFPAAYTHDRAFNPIGSLVSLGVFAAISLIFYQWMLLHRTERSVLKSWTLMALSVVALFILFLVNAFIAWLVLALSMIAFLALALSLPGETAEDSSPVALWKPMFILVLSVLFVAFQFLPQVLNPRNLINVNLPVEIQLSNSTTWNLVGNSMSGSAKKAILGSGPGTTGIAFGGIKPQDLNKTIVWSLNFDRGSSEISNVAIETGLLGLITFELTCFLFLIYALFFLLKKTSHTGWLYALGFFLLWLSLYITHFFYFFNTTFYFLFWLSIALFMAIVHWNKDADEDEHLSLAASPRSALSWMFLSLLVLALLLVGAFFEAAVYGSDVVYAQGVAELNKPKPNFATVAGDFGRAIKLNPYRDVYYLAYGQNLIFQASEEAAKPQPNVQQIQSWMSDTINAGRAATNISPEKASNWSALAQFYTGIRSLVSGTDQFIIDAWQQAITRDPKNPSLYVQLAQAYSTASESLDPAVAGTGADADKDGLSDDMEAKLGSSPTNSDSNNNGVSDGDEVKAGFNPAGTGRLSPELIASFTKIDHAMLKKAEDALNKAIALKADLPDSYIALARVLEKANQLDKAKKQLDDAAKLFPNNADILFEQGRLTYNSKDLTTAAKIFSNVLALVPNHANALYSLGLIYQQQGDKQKALAVFEKVREITGPNVELEKQINALKQALAAPASAPAKKK